MKYVISLIAVLAASTANAALEPATWNSPSHGCLTCSNTTIDVISTGSVSVLTSGNFGPADWGISSALTSDVVGLTVDTEVNTYQTFIFDQPLAAGTLMYIEDFDTGLVAELNSFGGGYSILDSSSSVSAMGNFLSTTNGTQDGVGEILIQLDAGVTGVSIGYHDQAAPSDLSFTFAEPCAVPEPGSAAVMAGLFGLGALVYVRRRK